jgi:hypothetical protein
MLNEKWKKARRMIQIVVDQISPPPSRGARVDLFIGEVKGLITMPSMPLTTYPANRVHGQGGLDYYIRASPLAGQWDANACLHRPSDLRFVVALSTFDSWPSVVRQWDLSPSVPAWTFTWELPKLFDHLQNTFHRAKASWVWYPIGGPLEVAFTWRRRLTPNRVMQINTTQHDIT